MFGWCASADAKDPDRLLVQLGRCPDDQWQEVVGGGLPWTRFVADPPDDLDLGPVREFVVRVAGEDQGGLERRPAAVFAEEYVGGAATWRGK
jgi:hypothetical protein